MSDDTASLMDTGDNNPVGPDGFHGARFHRAGPVQRDKTGVTFCYWPASRKTTASIRELGLTVVRAPGEGEDMMRKAWATCSAKSRFGTSGASSPRLQAPQPGTEAKFPVDDLMRVMTWGTRLRWGQDTRLTTLEAAEAIESTFNIYCAEMLRELQDNHQGEGWRIIARVSSQEGTQLSEGETMVAAWQQGPKRRVLYQWQFIPVKVVGIMVATAGRSYKDLKISDTIMFAPTDNQVVKVRLEGGIKEYESLGRSASSCCVVS